MRTFLLLLLIGTFRIGHAQERPFEYAIDWKGGGNANPIHVNSISNQAKDIHAVVVNNNSALKLLWFNNGIQLIGESQAGSLKGETMQGGYIKDGKALTFFKSDKTDAVRSFVFNLQGGGMQEYTIPLDMDGKKYIGQLSTGNSFLYVTADKKQPVISVYNFSREGQVERADFDLGREDLNTGLSKNDLWKALSKSSGLSRSVDAAVVLPDIECDIDIANSPNKLYARGDSLLLIMDREKGKTQVFTMGLPDKSLAFDVIDREISSSDAAISRFNSFLLDDRLYYVCATSNKLTVNIHDFSERKEKAYYEVTEDEEIGFKNTPVMQEGSMFSKKAQRELGKTGQFLRKIVAGRVVITAVRKSGDTDEITIGAFKEVKSTSPGLAGAMGAAMAGAALGAGVYVYPTYTASWNRVTRFKMLIDPVSGKHIEGDVSPSVNEQIEEYSKSLKIPQGGSSVFKTSDDFRYAYYDRDERKLVIVTFKL